MSNYIKLSYNVQPVVIDSLSLSNWTIINTNTLSVSGDTVTQYGVGGWQEEMYISFSVPTSGSYTISYDYDIESGYVGDWAYYGFGLFLAPNNPDVYDHYQFYANSGNRIGVVLANPSTSIAGMKGKVTFTYTLNANTTYYLWYPGGALYDGVTYHLTFKNICVLNNPIKYNFNNILTFAGWNGYIAYCDSESILDYYPIGTLYKSVSPDFDPNVAFGGTWITTNFEGKTPVGFFDENSVSGGEETHTLTLSECPSHNHSFSRVLYATYGNDTQTSNWNNYRSTTGTYDKVANGRFTPNNNTDASTHNNVQASLICKIWERIA